MVLSLIVRNRLDRCSILIEGLYFLLQLKHEVLNVKRCDKRWVIRVLHNLSGLESEDVFDYVVVCSG